MIPEGKLYTDNYRLVGERSGNSPVEHVVTQCATKKIPFGTMVKFDGDEGVVCQPDGSGVLAGLAVRSTEAKGLDTEEYEAGDPVAVAVLGEFMAAVEEDVTMQSPVRIRIAEDKEHGYQEIGFADEKTGASASGLANDTTKYGAIATIDKTAVEIEVTGSAVQTLTLLIAAINTILGTKGSIALVNNKLKIQSATSGKDSSVSITDGLGSASELFASLTDINEDFEEPVSGSDEGDPLKKPGQFCTTAIAGQTSLLSGARFAGASVNGRVPVSLSGTFTMTND